MNYLIAGAVPVAWHFAQDKYYDDKDKMMGPETFLGMVHSNVPYSGGLSLAVFAILVSQGYIEDTIRNAIAVGALVYLPFFITSTKEYK